MPLPALQYDSRPLYEGLADAGHAIARTREADRQRAFLAAQQQSQQQYGYGQQQSQQAYGYGIHQDEQQIALARINAGLGESAADRDLKQQGMQHDAAMDYYKLDPQGAQPVPASGMPGYYVSPKTGQVIAPATKKATTVPDGWKPQVLDVNGTKLFQPAPGAPYRPVSSGAADALAAMFAGGGQGGAPATGGAPTAAKGAAPAKPLDATTAGQFLQQAGGDKVKARALAKAAGYTF